jgi:glycosyltransferase involved in cell wall biosynthesis
VGKGDWQGLADKVIQWLRNPELLKADSDWSEKRARDFHYDIVADMTIAAYQGAVDRKRAKLAAL